MLDRNDHPACAQIRIFKQLLHAQDGAAGDVDRVALFENLRFRVPARPRFDRRPDFVKDRKARGRRCEAWILGEFRTFDQRGERSPDGRLNDHVHVVVLAARAAAQRGPGLTSARGVSRARYDAVEGLVRILAEPAVLQALLVAHLHAAQVQNGILHRADDALAASAVDVALVERREDRSDGVDARARVADLRTGHRRPPIGPARRTHRAAHRLRDGFVRFEILVATRPEAFDRSVDQARIDFLDRLPGVALAIEHSRAEVLDEDIGLA